MGIDSWQEAAAVAGILMLVGGMLKWILDLHNRQGSHERECSLRYQALETAIRTSGETTALIVGNLAKTVEDHKETIDKQHDANALRLDALAQRMDRLVGPARRSDVT